MEEYAELQVRDSKSGRTLLLFLQQLFVLQPHCHEATLHMQEPSLTCKISNNHHCQIKTSFYKYQLSNNNYVNNLLKKWTDEE